MTEKTKVKIVDCAAYMADNFSRVSRESLHPEYIVKVNQGEFGCDDYHLLFKTIWGNNPDCMLLYQKAIQLREALDSPPLKNAEVASMIEALGFQPNSEPDTLYQVSLTGFWCAKAPPIQY